MKYLEFRVVGTFVLLRLTDFTTSLYHWKQLYIDTSLVHRVPFPWKFLSVYPSGKKKSTSSRHLLHGLKMTLLYFATSHRWVSILSPFRSLQRQRLSFTSGLVAPLDIFPLHQDLRWNKTSSQLINDTSFNPFALSLKFYLLLLRIDTIKLETKLVSFYSRNETYLIFLYNIQERNWSNFCSHR